VKILLTGGSGFLGSALARYLQNQGHEVALLLRPASSLTRLQDRDFDIGRCADDAGLAAFVQRVRPQAVIHTACAYGRQGETLLQLTDANLRLGLSLLQALQSLPAADAPRLFLNTGTALPAEVSTYALSKRQFAQWGRRLALTAQQQLRFVNVELEHMYGPGDDASKFTTYVLRSCARHEPVLKLTAGEQRRDFIFIDDVLSGYATLLERAAELGLVADVPLGSGTAPTVREFVQTAHRLCRSHTELQFGALPYRPGEAMHCQADLAQMSRLGWSPRWSLEQGLRHTLELEFPQA
jgi:nucleoside-diphosphate-sugar epimerase